MIVSHNFTINVFDVSPIMGAGEILARELIFFIDKFCVAVIVGGCRNLCTFAAQV
jgi:hypothetical protein